MKYQKALGDPATKSGPHLNHLSRPLNIPCQSNSDRTNPITPELKF